MPNWCENDLVITGDNEILKDFVKVAQSIDEQNSTKFCINNFVPVPLEILNNKSEDPEVLKELTQKYIYGDWYQWSINNWGTKWDVGCDYLEFDEESAHYIFDSAWAPPVAAVTQISKQYPNLTFNLSYKELGADFVGLVVLKNGETIEQIDLHYSEVFGDTFKISNITTSKNSIKITCNADVLTDFENVKNYSRENIEIIAKITFKNSDFKNNTQLIIDAINSNDIDVKLSLNENDTYRTDEIIDNFSNDLIENSELIVENIETLLNKQTLTENIPAPSKVTKSKKI